MSNSTARATVILPTFGEAKFARWAIKSVRQQTVKNIEICIICDGSSENMISFLKDIAIEDPRIKIFTFPKSQRTGEPYRDMIIRQTTGNIICYCSHDDLWLPNHVEVVGESLKKYCFTHTLHTVVNMPENVKDDNTIISEILGVDMEWKKIVETMQNSETNFFGLTYAAHTRKSYLELDEPWITTPSGNATTDLYMWRKFLATFGDKCTITRKITALNFQQIPRIEWTEQQRDDELKHYFERIQTRAFIKMIDKYMYKTYPLFRWWTRALKRGRNFIMSFVSKLGSSA